MRQEYNDIALGLKCGNLLFHVLDVDILQTDCFIKPSSVNSARQTADVLLRNVVTSIKKPIIIKISCFCCTQAGNTVFFKIAVI